MSKEKCWAELDSRALPACLLLLTLASSCQAREFHPLIGQHIHRPDHHVPRSHLFALFWGPLLRGWWQGEGADMNPVCAGVQPGFALCSEGQE